MKIRELSDVVDYSQEFVCSHQMTQSPISTELSAFQTNLSGELVLCLLTESVHNSPTLHLRAMLVSGPHQGCDLKGQSLNGAMQRTY